MVNRWCIPAWLEQRIRKRDTGCVYCGISFKANSPRKVATWEHIDNDEHHICETNIVLCCRSCNSSKGTKTLSSWLKSPYCEQKQINRATVAKIIKRYIERKR
jgi:hypothetical protein